MRHENIYTTQPQLCIYLACQLPVEMIGTQLRLFSIYVYIPVDFRCNGREPYPELIPEKELSGCNRANSGGVWAGCESNRKWPFFDGEAAE